MKTTSPGCVSSRAVVDVLLHRVDQFVVEFDLVTLDERSLAEPAVR
jgi:hypothetical protein